jgi:hypothetical protein
VDRVLVQPQAASFQHRNAQPCGLRSSPEGPTPRSLTPHRRCPVLGANLIRALEARVLQASTDAPPCLRKTRGPAGEASKAEAARLRGTPAGSTSTTTASTGASPSERVVIDLAATPPSPTAAGTTSTNPGEMR